MDELEGRSKEIYTQACKYLQRFHHFPTYRWLIHHTDITTTSMILYYLEKLEKAGLLKRKNDGIADRWMVKGSTWTPPFRFTKLEKDGKDVRDRNPERQPSPSMD